MFSFSQDRDALQFIVGNAGIQCSIATIIIIIIYLFFCTKENYIFLKVKVK